jgi:hypothetical protein
VIGFHIFHIKEKSFVTNICDWLYHVYEHSCVGAEMCIVGWNSSEMVTGTSPICLSVVYQELTQENATSRKLMHSSQKTEVWQLGKSECSLALDAIQGGNYKYFGILGSLLSLDFPAADWWVQKSTHGCVIAITSVTCCWGRWLRTEYCGWWWKLVPLFWPQNKII